jgi:hypothetical protein
MTKTRRIPFAEFRAFLQGLGYVEKSAANALVFKHPEEGRLLFRPYRDDEAVEMHDLVYTRKFLDLRGVLEANDFDATLLRVDTPA